MTKNELENLRDYIETLIRLHESEDRRHYNSMDTRREEERIEYLEKKLLDNE